MNEHEQSKFKNRYFMNETPLYSQIKEVDASTNPVCFVFIYYTPTLHIFLIEIKIKLALLFQTKIQNIAFSIILFERRNFYNHKTLTFF